jgi:hypothetical protein
MLEAWAPTTPSPSASSVRRRHPSKEFLKSWYGRLGYRLVRTTKLDDGHPHLAPLLATPCDLEVHEKPLRP